MADAKARAEARRQAILGRGNSRLAKLTSSARGDDGASIFDDPPVPSLPPSRDASPFTAPAPSLSSRSTPAYESPQLPPNSNPFAAAGGMPPGFESMGGADDPMSALMSMLSGGGPGGPAGGAFPPPPGFDPSSSSPFPAATPFSQPPAPTTARPSSEWVLILLRIVSVVSLVAYFAFWLEPRTYNSVDLHGLPSLSMTERWGEISRTRTGGLGGLQPVPFFWSFISLQALLQALRSFSPYASSTPQLPMLVQLALPQLPSNISATIRAGFSYFKLLQSLMDDLAVALVLLGGLIWASSSSAR